MLAKLPRDAGTTIRALDEALQDLNVKRQAYYSNSFVGNHVHKLCEVSPCKLIKTGLLLHVL